MADPPTALVVTAEGASCAARAVPSDSVSCMLAARRVRLIASRMVFRAQGESPASCARELGLNPAAPMLQHILNKNNSCNHGSRPRLPYGFRAGAGIGFRITPLQAASRYGRVLPTHLFQSLPAGNKSGINTTFCTHAYMPYCGSQRAGAGQRADGRELKSATPHPDPPARPGAAAQTTVRG